MVTVNEQDYLLKSYRYELPEESIAQSPAQKRDLSKLLVVNRESGELEISTFAKLADLIPDNALLVANNSKVLPARIYGSKETGGKVEFLLLTPLPLLMETAETQGDWSSAEVEGLLRASKPPKTGQNIVFSDQFRLEVITRGDFGKSRVRLYWQGELAGLFCELGHYPLPPYIKRPDTAEDAKRYQTIYAEDDKLGSVAAPTAGLHFTPEVRQSLAERGIEWAEVTLYVGYGTFSPVREADIRNHSMHKEYIEISADTALAVANAKAQGRPVLAVGTTSVRTLEGAYAAVGDIAPYAGWTEIYITPGYEFKVADKLLTNFHLPESSLLIMVSALIGREATLSAYKTALENDFRFFSYGDAMLIL
ncbi:tRNA preQ1(34) S-adenosylmethionine ribosyltransferase-isomerase QueA [Desulfovibrio ferrophilus]|uniref:S-adenosylmethionine:tRNA ribosyltransferase-isomerase n=1 Tax=Desulfovibrio ferrophilus TaxID=241368 RepID=A0A2Z6B1S5_9BACT|nr:tRNA preQ1(34) S-adenosylmethionine ribosyltransferase-isomerase QueA [Desulfovibrio ferrophilus]BBD09390.1 S-adenosylmethionine--tRNA ribosyltransferase-isomerase [Desulfovibrio ferrophilus]